MVVTSNPAVVVLKDGIIVEFPGQLWFHCSLTSISCDKYKVQYCYRCCMVSVSGSVFLYVNHNHEQFGAWTRVGPNNHVLGGIPDPPEEGAILGESPGPLLGIGYIRHEPVLYSRWQQ